MLLRNIRNFKNNNFDLSRFIGQQPVIKNRYFLLNREHGPKILLHICVETTKFPIYVQCFVVIWLVIHNMNPNCKLKNYLCFHLVFYVGLCAMHWIQINLQFTDRGQSIINVQIYFVQLFRGHKKQFSDQFLELDNK
jgi:hypothetical protein